MHAAMDEKTKTIRIAAVIIRNQFGEVLSVRKRGTDAFMLPGGKLEEKELPVETARREIAEELHLEIERGDLQALGTMRAPAANEPGYTVVCEVFAWSKQIHEPGLTRGSSGSGSTREEASAVGEQVNDCGGARHGSWDGIPATIKVYEEIVEARWFTPRSTSDLLAPLSREVVFPVL